VNPADYVFASAMIMWAFGSFARAASGAAKYRKRASSITAVLQMTHLTLDQAIVMGVTIQTLLLFVENYRLAGGEPLPFSYTEFLRFFGFFTLDLEYIFPVGCIDGFKYWIELVTLSVLLIATGIITFMSYLKAKQREGPKAAAHLERFVLFLKFVLPGVVRTSGKAFTCRTFENDAYKSYLIVNYEMDCQSFDYLYLVRPYAAACIIFYGFLVPASMCFFLTRLRVHISNAFKAGLLSFKKATTSEKVEGGSEELTGKEMVEALHKGINANPILRGTALKCLFRFTKPECWWIEIADMYRRLCLNSAPWVVLDRLNVLLVSPMRQTLDCRRSWRLRLTITTTRTCSLDTTWVLWLVRSILPLILLIIRVVVATLRITSARTVDSVITPLDCAAASLDTLVSRVTSRRSTSNHYFF